MYFQSPYPTTSFTGLRYSRSLFTCPTHTRARNQTTRASPYTSDYSLLNLSALLHSFLPSATTIKALDCPFPPCSLCLLTNPGASPCGPGRHVLVCPLLLGAVSSILFFQWWPSHDLLVSQHLNNNKPYIVKHTHL